MNTYAFAGVVVFVWAILLIIIVIPLLVAAMFLRLDPNVWMWRMFLLAGIIAGVSISILLCWS